MTFSVVLTEDAARDLEELYDYVAQHDSPRKAEAVLDKMEALFEGLSTAPERGTRPKELAALGIGEYRQVFFKPYRVIYRGMGHEVYVMLIADGHQDMQSLLERRLLDAD